MARRFKRENFLFPIDLRSARGEVSARATDPFERPSEGTVEQAPQRPYEISRPEQSNNLLSLARTLGVAAETATDISGRQYQEYTERATAEGAQLASQDALDGNRRAFKQVIQDTRLSQGDEAARDVMGMSPHLKKGFDQTRARAAALGYNASMQAAYGTNPLLEGTEEDGVRLHDVDVSDPLYQQWLAEFTEEYQQSEGVNLLDPVASATFLPAIQDAQNRVSLAHDELRSSRKLQEYESATTEFVSTALYELHGNSQWATGNDADALVATANLIRDQLDEANALGYGGEDLQNIYSQVVQNVIAVATTTGNEKLLDVLNLVEVGNPNDRKLLLKQRGAEKYTTAVASARQQIADREFQEGQRDRQLDNQRREDGYRDSMEKLAIAGAFYENSGRTPEAYASFQRVVDAERQKAAVNGYAVPFNSAVTQVLQTAVDTQGVPIVDYAGMNALEASIVNEQISGVAAQRRLNDLWASGALGSGADMYKNYQRMNSLIKNKDDQNFSAFSGEVNQAAAEYEQVIKGRLGYTEDENGRIRTVKQTLEAAGMNPNEILGLTQMSEAELDALIVSNQEAAAQNQEIPFSAQQIQAMYSVVVGGVNPLNEPEPLDPGDVQRQVIDFKNRLFAENESFREREGRDMTPQERSEFIRNQTEAAINGQRGALPSSNPLSSSANPNTVTSQMQDDFYGQVLGNVGTRTGNPRTEAIMDNTEAQKAFEHYVLTDRWHPEIVDLAEANGMSPMDLVMNQARLNGVTVRDDLAMVIGMPTSAQADNTGPVSAVFPQRSTRVSPKAREVTSIAMNYAGTGYNPGVGEQCAFFVRDVFRDFGIELPVTSDRQSSRDPEAGNYGAGAAVSLIGSDVGVVHTTSNVADIPEGAIIGLTNTYGDYGDWAITHVGVSVGGGFMVDRPTSSGTVTRRSVSTFPPAPDGQYVYVIPHQLTSGNQKKNNVASSGGTTVNPTRNQDMFNSIAATAQRLGVEPLQLAAVFAKESSLNINADNGTHQGLFQASADVRDRYGVYAGMPAGQQMAAFEAYMRDRGYRPGMGMEALYATILVGNPQNRSSSGAYNPADGNGTTVLDALERFAPNGDKYREAMEFFGIQ